MTVLGGAARVSPGALRSMPTRVSPQCRWACTEMNARLQAQAMALGGNVRYLEPEEARKAEVSVGGTIRRPWELWKRKALAK